MASAYNRALSYPAKYKVYIHQDTYLINREMFYTLISLFKDNEKLGLIGVAGAQFYRVTDMVGRKNLVGKVIEYRRRNYQLLNLDQGFMEANLLCRCRQLMAYSWQRSMIFRGEKICFKGSTFMMYHSLRVSKGWLFNWYPKSIKFMVYSL